MLEVGSINIKNTKNILVRYEDSLVSSTRAHFISRCVAVCSPNHRLRTFSMPRSARSAGGSWAGVLRSAARRKASLVDLEMCVRTIAAGRAAREPNLCSPQVDRPD